MPRGTCSTFHFEYEIRRIQITVFRRVLRGRRVPALSALSLSVSSCPLHSSHILLTELLLRPPCDGMFRDVRKR